MIVYVQIIYLLICIAEAWLEQAVIYLKNPNIPDYNVWNKKEHDRSAVYAIGVGLSLSSFPALYGCFYQTAILIPLIFFIRRIGFDFALKVIRGRRISAVEGDQPIDKFVRWILGKNGGWWDVLLCIVFVCLINWISRW